MFILKLMGSFILIAAITIICKLLFKKVQINNMLKTVILGFVFGGVSIACSYLSPNGYVGFANSSVFIGGVVFGGPVGLIAGLLSALERYITGNFGALEIAKYSVVVTLLISGMLSAGIRKFINGDKGIKWYFGFVCGLILETIGMLLMFLFNMNNTDGVYNSLKDLGILDLVLNSIVVGVTFILCCVASKQQLIKFERPVGIQTKIQISLGITIILGFIIVASVSYGVLDNISKKSTISTMEMTISDVEDNLISDVEESLLIEAGKIVTEIKSQRRPYVTEEEYEQDPYFGLTYEQYINSIRSNYKSVLNIIFFTYIVQPRDVTLFRADGTPIISSDPNLESLNNISDLNVEYLQTLGETYTQYTSLVLPYQYIESRGENLKLVYKQYDMESYILVTFDTEDYQQQIKNSIEKGIASRHIGEDGFIVVADSSSNILSCPTDQKLDSINFNVNNQQDLGITEINGKEYYYYSENFVTLKIIGLMGKESCDLNKNISVDITSLTEILVFFLLYGIIYFAISSSVINPLKRVNESLSKISSGELNEKVNENGSSELKSLSEDINQTVDSLKDYIGREAKMLQDELNFAKGIQLSSLQQTYPDNDKIELFALMDTAKEVGGDFYDFYFVDDNHFCILIADVSGKGIPAALFMMQSKTLIKSYIESKLPLEEAFNKANKELCDLNQSKMFVTVWCGVLDLTTGELEFVNAGHNKPLIKRNDKFEFIECKHGFIFGVIDSIKYKTEHIKLDKNSEVYLYTDGVNEATNINEELYGNDRMINCANSLIGSSSKDFCNNMLKSVKDFTDEAEQSDDITQLHIKYNG